MELKRQLENHLRVGSPALWLTSREEPRSLALIRAVARTMEPGRLVFYWSCTRGLRQAFEDKDPGTMDLSAALERINQDRSDGAICVLLDPDFTCPTAARTIRDFLSEAQPGERCILALSPVAHIHETLRQTFILLELPPLSPRSMAKVLENTLKRHSLQQGRAPKIRRGVKALLSQAAGGMTQGEFERAINTLLLKKERLSEVDVQEIQGEKCKMSAGDPLLRYEENQNSLDDIGGMVAFKAWITTQRNVLTLPKPKPPLKGVLLVSMPGCGHSIAVRATAHTWGLPLIELDGMHFGVMGGASEKDVDRALKKVEAAAPCLLWIPRLDAAFESQGEMGGRPINRGALVLERYLLSKDRKAIVLAGARDPAHLPLDVVIRGAFDQLFFLDLPSSSERREILQISLERRSVPAADLNLEMLVAASDGFSGAQIIQAIDRSLRELDPDMAPLKMVSLLDSLRQATPMAEYLGDSRRRIKTWSHRWAVPVSGQREP